jgi:type VI protein secretion system component Hcp
MDRSTNDLVMKFTLNRQPVWAECALTIPDEDTLMSDFTRNADYDSYTNFFEVNEFEFGVSLKEEDENTGAFGQAQRPANGSRSPIAGAFSRWRSATQNEYKSIYYPLEFDKFSFSRVIDSASPIFFQACCNSSTFDDATLVKRISQGQQGGVDRPSVGFLRIDFKKVLIIGIGWDDGDVVRERCEFICQGMKITYRRQKADGTVTSGAGNESQAEWPNPRKDRSLNIRSGGRP